MHLKAFPVCLNFLCGLFFCLGENALGQSSCLQTHSIIEKIQQLHVAPPATDTEEFKRKVLDNFVREIDPQALYFSNTELKKITAFSLQLEKQQLNVCQIVNETNIILREQLTEYKIFATSFLSKPIHFSSKDFFRYEINSDKNTFESKALLSQKWGRWLTLQTLMRMQHEASIHSGEPLQSFEEKARKKVLTHQLKTINQILNPPLGIEQFITVHFFKALATAFDPHTEFFSKSEMKEFQTALSSKAFSWGFDLGENKFGRSTINKVIPGGSAWNSNRIHPGDEVIELSFEDGSVLETLDFSVRELNHELRDQGRRKITIKLQRLDGVVEIIHLEKSEIDSEENSVHSFILKNEKKVGYISLPAFYTDWSDPLSKGCANDVAKEIVKLKKEGISGIILDLRFNGGGLVEEAVDLAGIFIDFGPLLIFKEKDQPPLVLKDLNRGVVYDGPLLVLINGLSASASEIVAAALQDHNRAIIAGSSSFGKSTGQSVFPVVTNDTLGFVKITQDKIYRVTGKTHQRVGVKPDIPMTDLTDLYGFKEGNYVNALPSDSISKKIFFTPLPALPIDKLNQKSQNRMTSSGSFQRIKAEHDSFTLNIPLEPADFENYMARGREHQTGRIENKHFEVVPTQFDNRMLQVDSYNKEINQQLIQEISVSPYIEESFNVLLDYIQLKSK